MLARGLAIKEKALGAEHIGVAASLANVARTYERLGDHERAAATYRRALAILDQKNPEHQYAAFVHHGLGEVLVSQGEYDAALLEASRGLAIREASSVPRTTTWRSFSC